MILQDTVNRNTEKQGGYIGTTSPRLKTKRATSYYSRFLQRLFVLPVLLKKGKTYLWVALNYVIITISCRQ